jgi:ABC-2 type transport system ATP-binding protein
MTMSTDNYAIVATGIRKSFGKVKVLEGIDLKVKRGTILALLGPNGAGKTTTVRILATLLDPDEGTALVEGYDVTKEGDHVRSKIGLTGQYAAVDEYLTGKENLTMMGRLYRLSKADANRRADELLELVDLVEPSTRPVRTYSGGMKRRLDLAMSLIANPPVIFLDEPTTGLDPRSRIAIWDMIKKLVKNGTTILLTTQYLDEADILADNIIVIDGGKVIAEGTADSLKAKIGSDRLEVVVTKSSYRKAFELLSSDKSLQADEESRTLSVASKAGIKTLKDVLQKLEGAKVTVETVALQRPTLDDVFLTLTGHATTQAEEAATDKKGKK